MACVFLTECDQGNYLALARKYIFMKMAGFNQNLVGHHDHQAVLGRLCGVIVSKQDAKASMAENIKNVCQNVLGFSNATKENGIKPLAGLEFQKDIKRVVMHPESGNPIKNWPEKKFIQLAAKLKEKGFTPAFITSPKEREKWQTLIANRFELPLFPSLSDAAAYIYQSGLMVGNDSGIGHLASNLNIATYSIHRKKDRYYRWRPGWGPGQLILPAWTFKWKGKLHWRPFLSVARVLSVLKI